jgi:hypothetical protein
LTQTYESDASPKIVGKHGRLYFCPPPSNQELSIRIIKPTFLAQIIDILSLLLAQSTSGFVPPLRVSLRCRGWNFEVMLNPIEVEIQQLFFDMKLSYLYFLSFYLGLAGLDDLQNTVLFECV